MMPNTSASKAVAPTDNGPFFGSPEDLPGVIDGTLISSTCVNTDTYMYVHMKAYKESNVVYIGTYTARIYVCMYICAYALNCDNKHVCLCR